MLLGYCQVQQRKMSNNDDVPRTISLNDINAKTVKKNK